MTKAEAIKFVLLRSLGNFLLLFALYGVGATFGPALYYEVQFRVIEIRGVHFDIQSYKVTKMQRIVRSPRNQKDHCTSSSLQLCNSATLQPSSPGFALYHTVRGFADILAGSREQIIVPKDTDFSIVIPKLAASAKVFPNVDPDNPQEYLPVLQQGIAHAKGSVFPGMPGNVYLFAHSTDNWWDVGRYNAVFYLLHDLSPGDEVVVFFENRRYEYTVSQKFLSDPTDVSQIARDHNGHEQLVLQTCWPPGTAWKRLYIVAKPKGVPV